MTVLVTGASGFVGSRIMCAVPGAVACPSLRDMNQKQISALIDEVMPDMIVNTAAISDIGVCEKDPDASYAANVELPLMLARAAGDAKLINFSSDQVYSGCAGTGPYREDDELSPANTYARHKLEAEQRLLELLPQSVILRATWMYDMVIYGGVKRGNFLLNTMRAVMAGKDIFCSKEQYRGITYVREVADSISALHGVPGGVYNFGSENNMNMYDTAKSLLEALGADTSLLKDAPGRHNLQMDCQRLTSLGIGFSATADGLRKCLCDYGLNSL